jgi:hypothetical protein
MCGSGTLLIEAALMVGCKALSSGVTAYGFRLKYSGYGFTGYGLRAKGYDSRN